MKRFIIRQLSLILAMVMLLTLAGVAEAPSANDADIQDIVLDGLSLDDLFIDGELEVEIDQNAGVDLTLDEITLDEIPGEAGDGSDPVDVEGIEGDVLVDEAIDQTGLDVQGTGDSTYQAHYDLSGAASDNDALADAYLRGVLPGFGKGDRTFASPNAGRKGLVKKGLTGSLAVYDAIKPMIVEVAEGRRTSTVFEFDAAALGTGDHWWSAADLGAANLSDPGIGGLLLAKEGIDSWGIISALLEDCPYHLYWFDKTMGWNTGCQYSTQGDTARLESLTLSFVVSADYAAGTYAVNALPARINAAVTNINKAVNDNANKGDLEKVTAYADIICGYVEYNHPAADDSSTPYGDPWQLVWIFDGDPDTKVVCEGYAKGFKYLCDLSSFDGDVGCVLPMGTMTGGTGAGRHMWNSLKMPDGRCYLVDLTNCDGGDACNYSLFLKGATGDAGGPYVCAGLRYEFDDATVSTFGAGSLWLTYSNVDYGKEDAGGGDTTVNAAWSAFQKAIDSAGNNATVTLTEDLTAGGGNAGLRIPSGKTLTLDLAGHTLDRGLKAEKNDGYVVGVEGSLTVTDSAGGGRITGGWTSTYGGGIYVDNGASLTLKGGTICGNKAFNGGGIGAPNGSIVISGGVVSDNHSINWGGGVWLNGGKIVMTGGDITGNQSSFGGGVWLMNGQFEMKGGKITNNDAYNDLEDPYNGIHVESGGGVYGYGADIILSGGEISGNRANVTGGDGKIFHPVENFSYLTKGGGLAIYYGTLKMTGGTIKNNTASEGGGLMVEDAECVMTGGTITCNTGSDGGGVMVHACNDTDTASFTMNGGAISDNTAEYYGAGIYVWGTNGNAICQLNSGEITGNAAYGQGGGGIFGFFSTIKITGGKINNNQKIGLYIHASSSEMTGGEIRGNQGGGVFVTLGVFTLSGGCIAENISSGCGGGIYVNGAEGETVLNMSGGIIRDNTTSMDGGGIDAGGDEIKVNISGGEITGNTATRWAGGVFLGVNNQFSGSPVISGNRSGSGDATIDDNCYLLGNPVINVVGALEQSARIGVTQPNVTQYHSIDSCIITNGLGANGNIGAFFSDDPNFTIEWNNDGNEAMLVKKQTPTDPTQPTDPAQPTDPSTPTAKVKLSKCKFTVKDQVYTGKAIKAAVTVKYGKKKLKQGTDYTVAYKNNKNVGAATVTVTGKGGYTGKKTLSFKILPRKSAITKASVKGKTATLTLKRQPEATGYEVQYGLKSNFAGAKSVKVKQAKTVKATLKSLQAGKTYYARVRTYKTVGKKTYYSAWSGKKSFKVK